MEDFQKKIDPKKEYWDGVTLLKKDVHYAMCISERTSGKTFFFQCLAMYQWHKLNWKTVYVKRVAARVTKSQMESMFTATFDKIPLLTDDVYNAVMYQGMRFYLCYRDEDGTLIRKASEPFMIVLALNVQDDTKSVFNDNSVKIVWFEEFITRERYLHDEFLKFTALISTVVRLRDDCLIAMTANTVNKYCPYFTEMGLYRVKEQPQGTIDIYRYGESKLRVAVEYTAEMEKSGRKKPSNVYFAFDNPRLEMVKTGMWEIANYPHLPFHSKADDIITEDIWVQFKGVTLQGDIRYNENRNMMYARFWQVNKEEINIKDNTVIYTDGTPTCRNYRKFFRRYRKLDYRLLCLMADDRVYYSDNEAGEIMNNFLKESMNNDIIRG